MHIHSTSAQASQSADDIARAERVARRMVRFAFDEFRRTADEFFHPGRARRRAAR